MRRWPASIDPSIEVGRGWGRGCCSAAPCSPSSFPAIAVDLAADESLSQQRFDQIGSVGLGVLVAMAITVAALPVLRPVVALLTIAGGGVVAAVAGTTIAFVADPALGTSREARVLQGAGWLTAGAVLAACAVALVVARRVSRVLVAVVAIASMLAVLVAIESSGRDVDYAWWLLSLGLLTALALFEPSSFAERRLRDRPTLGVAMTAAAAAVVAVAAIARAESHRSTWTNGSLVLGIAVVVLAAIASVAVVEAARARRHAQHAAGSDRIAGEREPSPSEVPARAAGPVQPASTLTKPRSVTADDEDAPVDTEGAPTRSSAPAPAPAPAAAAMAAEAVVPEPPEDDAHEPRWREDELEDQPYAHEVDPDETRDEQADEPGVADLVAITLAPERVDAESADATPKYAAMPLGRHLDSLEPHHFDPPTGLLSGAGLQEIVARAFAQCGPQGRVALLMIALRNIDEIEADHGRLAVAHINRVIAERLQTALPRAACAHYLRAGFAAVLERRHPIDNDPIEACTEALVSLLDEITVRGESIRVDVVGGMAQSYSDEDAAGLVRRANSGLDQAVQSPEASLVSMP